MFASVALGQQNPCTHGIAIDVTPPTLSEFCLKFRTSSGSFSRLCLTNHYHLWHLSAPLPTDSCYQTAIDQTDRAFFKITWRGGAKITHRCCESPVTKSEVPNSNKMAAARRGVNRNLKRLTNWSLRDSPSFKGVFGEFS